MHGGRWPTATAFYCGDRGDYSRLFCAETFAPHPLQNLHYMHTINNDTHISAKQSAQTKYNSAKIFYLARQMGNRARRTLADSDGGSIAAVAAIILDYSIVLLF